MRRKTKLITIATDSLTKKLTLGHLLLGSLNLNILITHNFKYTKHYFPW